MMILKGKRKDIFPRSVAGRRGLVFAMGPKSRYSIKGRQMVKNMLLNPVNTQLSADPVG